MDIADPRSDHQIATRTHPNLFDLLIALLSGLAGGYGMVHGRGGAIVGVAIATALMPPMAVVGYGQASSQWAVARGALLLFTTNFVAIALGVTAFTTWSGFNRRRVRHAVVWQTGLAFLLILPLTIPLWYSLLAISQAAQLVGAVRQTVATTLGADHSRVISLQVGGGSKGKPTRVDLILAARHYDREKTSACARPLPKWCKACWICGFLRSRKPILPTRCYPTRLSRYPWFRRRRHRIRPRPCWRIFRFRLRRTNSTSRTGA